MLCTPFPLCPVPEKRPAQYCPIQRGWFQDGRRLHKVKATKALVWPKDGRMDTSWGRFKDILKGQGPDMYLTFNAHKRDYMDNRPTRAQWAGWKQFDYRGPEPFPLKLKRWTPTPANILGDRHPEIKYDYRTRKYAVPNRYTWSNAIWQDDQRDNKYNRYPEAVRDVHGRWLQDRHHLPWLWGGPYGNEQGTGAYEGPFVG